MTEKEAIAKAPSGRPKRVPVGTRHRLSVSNQEPGFIYRWVNTTDDRPGMFQAAGYELVDTSKHKIGDPRLSVGSSIDNSISVGGGTKAVLMRQRDEFYKEDQDRKQAEVSRREQGILKPTLEGSYGSVTTDRDGG